VKDDLKRSLLRKENRCTPTPYAPFIALSATGAGGLGRYAVPLPMKVQLNIRNSVALLPKANSSFGSRDFVSSQNPFGACSRDGLLQPAKLYSRVTLRLVMP
jgi:hypothetical protein